MVSQASREQQQPLPGEAWLQNPAPETQRLTTIPKKPCDRAPTWRAGRRPPPPCSAAANPAERSLRPPGPVAQAARAPGPCDPLQSASTAHLGPPQPRLLAGARPGGAERGPVHRPAPSLVSSHPSPQAWHQLSARACTRSDLGRSPPAKVSDRRSHSKGLGHLRAWDPCSGCPGVLARAPRLRRPNGWHLPQRRNPQALWV